MSPYKDPIKKAEYIKNYQRKRRNEGIAPKLTRKTELTWKVKTASGLLDILEHVINEILDTDGLDVAVRARTISSLLGVGVRLCEAVNIEARIKTLEDKLSSPVRELVDD